MKESADLQGEETTPNALTSRVRMMLTIIPVLLVFGGIVLWMTWPSSEEFVAQSDELQEIPAATAPPIVPASNDVSIDVPMNSAVPTTVDPNSDRPSYIPPAMADISAIPAPLETPLIDLMATTSYEEQRSKLLDALNADPVVDFDPIEDEPESVSLSPTRNDRLDRKYALIPGSVIPSVLLQGINTDLSGIAVAQVSRDVYDSTTGSVLLIPRGSRIFGRYGTELLLSDERVLVTWERIDLPNGGVIDLEDVIGADQSGNSGLKDQVHRHTGRALTVTGLSSLISAGLAHAASASDPALLRETADGRFIQEQTFSDQATRNVTQQYGDILGQIAQQHLDQRPTLTIRSGYEFVIQIAEEIKLNPYLP